MNNLTLNNGATTPVAKTFVAYLGQNGKTEFAEWVDQSSGMVAGYSRIQLLIAHDNRQKATKVTTIISVPKLVTDTQGNQVVQHKTLASLKFIFPDTATLDERKDLVAFTKNFLGHADISAALQALIPIS